MKGLQDYWSGTLVLTETSANMQAMKHIGDSHRSGETGVIAIPYADMASTQVEHRGRNCVVVIRQCNGRADSFALGVHVMHQVTSRRLSARGAQPQRLEARAHGI